MTPVQIHPFTASDLGEVKAFIDRWSGENFLTEEDLNKIRGLSVVEGRNSSLLARVGGELVGVRLTYAPGKMLGEISGLTPHGWDVPGERVGYFKSLFIAEEFRSKGIGRMLSTASLEILREMGAEAVLCHCWLESPGNSSQRYLRSMGFKDVATHAKFWYDVDYLCVRCAPGKCVCTSVEMIKYLP